MKLLKPLIISVITLFVLSWYLPTVAFTDIVTLIIAAAVLTLLQKVIRPLMNLLFLPINIVTLGIFSIVINVTLLWLATYLVPGFDIQAMTIGGIELNQFFTLWVISIMIGILQNMVGFFL